METSTLLKVSAAVIVGALVVIAFSRFSDSPDSVHYTPAFQRKIHALVRKARKQKSTAGQSQDALLRLITLTSAVNTINAIKDLTSTDQVRKITGVDLDEMLYVLEDEQTRTLSKIQEMAPSLRPQVNNAMAGARVAQYV